MTRNSVLILANDSKSILDFRWPLIEQCQEQDWPVTIVCNKDAYYSDLESKASSYKTITVLPLNFANGGINPLKDLALMVKIRRLYQELKPTHVLLYRIKPVLYGSLAAYALPLKVISTITGLGYVYTDPSFKASLLRLITNTLYKLALRRNAWVFFQNADDQQTLANLNLTTFDKSSVVGGSGIVLTEFPETPLPKSLSFVMVARLLKDKGIWEYLQAAARLKKIYPNVDFKLIGGESLNPSAIPLREVETFCQKNNLIYLGHKNSVLETLQESSIFVLPSYREGMPRSGLEALSVGRPIITTDTQGCRDLIRGNGLLVPIKDTAALQAAMQHLIDLPESLPQMAKISRHLAETVFDVKLVNKAMLAKLAL
ncbi:MAG: glycosyltransferase family 4 protein [Candidatus Paracaedibacteraceae bacterium]|nr:glycosyltransferase family 4 protein [Candidatus Paracaedibacteraceae bacterium]